MPPPPPGPRLHRLVQAVWLWRDPIGFLDQCRRRFGPVFTVRFPGIPPLAYVTDPAVARAIYGNSELRAGDARRPFLVPLVGDESLLCREGDRWRRQRGLLAPALHGDRVMGWRHEIAAIAEREIDRWPEDEVFAVRPRMQQITMEVILRVVFGLEDGRDRVQLRALLVDLLKAVENPLIFALPALREPLERSPLARRLPGSPLRRFLRLRAATDQLLFAEIRRRRADPDGAAAGSDVLSTLVGARDEAGEPMSDTEVRDELMTLLTAGHETTGTALAWAIERLVRHPEILARLTEEVDRGETAYLEAVIKEVLRSRPVVFDTPRAVATPVELFGYTIPQGWWVAPAIPLVHRAPRLFPDPDRFDPDRFLADEPPVRGWIPFGGGSRGCPGSRLALLELETVLTTLLTRHRLHPAASAGEVQRVQHVTLAPGEGGLAIMSSR